MSVFNYILFPGIIFAAAAGAAVCWIERKISALIQFRSGPPLLQPLYDILKLSRKETLIPAGAPAPVFLGAPVLGFSALILTAMILTEAGAGRGFAGDIFAVLYLLRVPVFSIFLAGASSPGPFSSEGASGEVRVFAACEVPLILSVVTVILKSSGELSLAGIHSIQSYEGAFAASLSGFIAFAAAFLCLMARSSRSLFDMPSSGRDIMGGVFAEYSGPPLALFMLSGWILDAFIPLLAVLLFLGGSGLSGTLLRYAGLLLFSALVKNIFPRLRIDQIEKFFRYPVTAAAAFSVLLGGLGL